MLSAAPQKQITMVRICQQPKIMALKKGSVILKFTEFIDQNADKFRRIKDPVNPVNAPELVELTWEESDANQFIYDTQELHDRYVQDHPELMVDLPEPPGPGAAAKMAAGDGSKFRKFNTFGGKGKGKGYGGGGGKGYGGFNGGGFGGGGFGGGGYGGF